MSERKATKARFAESFKYAFEGIAATAKGRNFKVQSCAGILAVLFGLLFDISACEWLAVLICCGLVLGGECMNTSLEALVDLTCPETHPLAKLAKDAAAGAVLCFAISSFVVGLIIFVPKFIILI